jgi:hypothetical protein
MAPATRAINLAIYLGAGLFIAALWISAIFDPTIRLLHVLQSFIYIAVIIFARRQNAWAFGAGFAKAAFWNYINLFVTTFIYAGWLQLIGLMQTGQLRRPDLFIALIAAGGNFILLAACGIGFLRTRPAARQWAQFAAGGALAIAYFVLIIVTTGKQYTPLLRRVLHLT